MRSRSIKQLAIARLIRGTCRLHREHPCERGFLGSDPVMDKYRVAHQKGCHSKPGRIADPKGTPDIGIELGGFVPPACARYVFRQFALEMPDHVDAEHFCAIGPVEFGVPLDHREIAQAELAVAIDGGRPHQVAHIQDLLNVRLASGRQCVDDRFEKPDRLVGARQNEFLGGKTSGLLPRDVLLEPREIGFGDLAVYKHKTRIPFFGDDAVGPLLGRKRIGKSCKRHRTARHADRPCRATVARRVQIPDGPIERPPFGRHPSHQAAHEGEPRGEGGSHPAEPHDLVRRPQFEPVGSKINHIHDFSRTALCCGTHVASPSLNCSKTVTIAT